MPSDELWSPVPEFPEYLVSNYGNFAHTRFERPMVLSPNQGGTLTVGFNVNGKQYRRSAKKIVAEVFVEPLGEIHGVPCDTPLQLDGDQNNLHWTNIVWRPRWFVWQYQAEMRNPRGWHQHGPLEDRFGNRWETIEECAQSIGGLRIQIVFSCHNGTKVFPSGERFYFVQKSIYWDAR